MRPKATLGAQVVPLSHAKVVVPRLAPLSPAGSKMGDSPLRQSTGGIECFCWRAGSTMQALDTLLRAGILERCRLRCGVCAHSGRASAAYVEPAVGRSWNRTKRRWAGLSRGDNPTGCIGVTSVPRSCARRFVSDGRRWPGCSVGIEAAEFYPAKWRARLQAFVEALAHGRDASASAADRAVALWMQLDRPPRRHGTASERRLNRTGTCLRDNSIGSTFPGPRRERPAKRDD